MRHDHALLGITVFVAIIVVLWWLMVTRAYRWYVFNNRPLGRPKLSKHQCTRGRRYRDFWIPCGDGKVHVRWFNDFPEAKTVLFCHGNFGTIEDRGYIVEITRIARLNLVLFDYRGFGSSIGSMNEATVLHDATAVHDFITSHEYEDRGWTASLQRRHKRKTLVLWGESLGVAVAIYTAVHCGCEKLILVAGFASLTDLLHHASIHQALRGVASPLLLDSMKDIPAKRWAQHVHCPVLIVHSRDDELVSPANAPILYDALGSTDKSVMYVKGPHASPILSTTDFKTVDSFVHARPRDNYSPRTSAAEQMVEAAAEYRRLWYPRYSAPPT